MILYLRVGLFKCLFTKSDVNGVFDNHCLIVSSKLAVSLHNGSLFYNLLTLLLEQHLLQKQRWKFASATAFLILFLQTHKTMSQPTDLVAHRVPVITELPSLLNTVCS